MDVFTWSLPFLAEKVMSMVLTIINKIGDADEEEPETQKPETLMNDKIKQERIKSKGSFKKKL